MSVHSKFADTNRLRIHYLEGGDPAGVPVLMIHGNLATGRFFDHVIEAAPTGYRFLAPDMRGFGDTEPKPIDATRGLRDWADDAYSLIEHLGIDEPVHLVGWSTGGAAVANYAMDRPAAVRSITFIDPVSPYGFGGTKDADGTLCYDDYAGSGGGTGNPDFAALIADGDTSDDSPLSPRNVMNSSYWHASHREPKEREDLLLDEVLKSVTGEDGYPGDMVPSENWPGVAPGTRGILNALSSKYCSWSGIVDIDPKPAILWTHGTEDIVISNNSAWDMGTLGQMGVISGWPGAGVFPVQPMVDQIRTVLESYAANGGQVRMEMIEGAGHGPHFDHFDEWSSMFYDTLAAN